MARSRDDGSQQKTEKPTAQRLRRARREGDVAQSRDLTSTLGLVALTALLGFAGRDALAWSAGTLQGLVGMSGTALPRPAEIGALAQRVLLASLLMCAPVVALLVGVGVLASGLQAGGVLAFGRLAPDLDRLNPVSGLKQMFSARTAMEAVKLLVKTAIVAALLVAVARQSLPLVVHARHLPLPGLMQVAGGLLTDLLWALCAGFLFIALFDLAFQRWDYLRRHRMSKDEVRREHKESEGDPILRGRRKQLHQELSMERMLGQVRRASVVIVNPTHVAVALYYTSGETDLPVVVGKGEGYVAEAIREAARQAGVPVFRDVPLARALQADAPLDQYIPEDLIEPVAAVLRWVRDFAQQANPEL